MNTTDKLPPSRASEILDNVLSELGQRNLTVAEVALFFIWMNEMMMVYCIKQLIESSEDTSNSNFQIVSMGFLGMVANAQKVSRDVVIEKLGEILKEKGDECSKTIN